MEINRFNVNCSIVFQDLNLLERPAAAAGAGYVAIESWWPFAGPVPSTGEARRFAEAVEEAGVALRALNLYSGDMSAGERGILSHPTRESEFEDSLGGLDDVASRLGCRVFNALYGLRLEDEEAQLETAIRRLGRLEAFAAARDATIVLEPISGIPGYPLRLASDVFRIIDAVPGAAHVKLLADVYHLTVNEDDVEGVLEQIERIGHVQVADAPGRHEPGTGALPIAGWLELLGARGYTGAIGLEYAPLEDPVASLHKVKKDLIDRSS